MTSSIREAIPLNKSDVEVEEVKEKTEKEPKSYRRSMTNLNIQQSNFRSEIGKTGSNVESKLIRRSTSIAVEEMENNAVLTRRNTMLTTPDTINYGLLDKKQRLDIRKSSTISSDTHIFDFEHVEKPFIDYNKRNLVHFSSKSSFDRPACIMEEDLEEQKPFKKSQTNCSSALSLYKPQATSSQRISISQQTKASSCLSKNFEYLPSFLMSTKTTDSNQLTPMGFTEKPSKRILLTKTPRICSYKSPLGSFREKRSGVALYNMNAFPIYLALWQQCD